MDVVVWLFALRIQGNVFYNNIFTFSHYIENQNSFHLIMYNNNNNVKNAILVRAPELEEVPVTLHKCITKESHPQQTVTDVDIGRVPKDVAGVLSEGMRKGWVVRGLVMHTGGGGGAVVHGVKKGEGVPA